MKRSWKDEPTGVRFHRGHTWVRFVSVNLAFVGATDFAIKFAGGLAGLALPADMQTLRAGEPAWRLLSRKGRTLGQLSPVGGQVLVVNSDLLEDPGGLSGSPYYDGWLFCLRSPRTSDPIQDLLSREADQEGLNQMIQNMETVLGSPLRVPFQEGAWRPDFGDEFTDEEWGTLRKRLFPTTHGWPAQTRTLLE